MRFVSRQRKPAPMQADEPLHHADMPPHGTRIGRILIEYRGQTVEAAIYQAGSRCRTHGVSIAGGRVQMMGLYRAAALVSAAVARMPGQRSEAWRDAAVSVRDEVDAAAAHMEMMG